MNDGLRNLISECAKRACEQRVCEPAYFEAYWAKRIVMRMVRTSQRIATETAHTVSGAAPLTYAKYGRANVCQRFTAALGVALPRNADARAF